MNLFATTYKLFMPKKKLKSKVKQFTFFVIFSDPLILTTTI